MVDWFNPGEMDNDTIWRLVSAYNEIVANSPKDKDATTSVGHNKKKKPKKKNKQTKKM